VYDYVYYTRYLGLTLYDRQLWREASEDTLGEAAVWTCNATSRGSSSDLRLIVNYLLVAAFDQFGVDSGRELRIKFEPDDPRVASMTAVGANATRSTHARDER
jgi:hypothetical protein